MTNSYLQSVYGKRAEELFLNGYNCAQSVFIAFSDLHKLDIKTASALASSFGAGLGRLREVCGAVSGGAMVLGILLGSYDPKDNGAKAEHYRLVQTLAEEFKKANGSYICKELLTGINTDTNPNPEKRTQEYYKKRPCGRLCYISASIVEEILKEKGVI